MLHEMNSTTHKGRCFHICQVFESLRPPARMNIRSSVAKRLSILAAFDSISFHLTNSHAAFEPFYFFFCKLVPHLQLFREQFPGNTVFIRGRGNYVCLNSHPNERHMCAERSNDAARLTYQKVQDCDSSAAHLSQTQTQRTERRVGVSRTDKEL